MSEAEEQNLNEGKLIKMKVKGKLNYMQLLVPVLLLAGMQMFAYAAADSPASIKTTGIGPTATFKAACSSAISAEVAPAGYQDRCPIPECAAPPPGCSYQGPPDVNEKGCPINCGHLVCDGGFDNARRPRSPQSLKFSNILKEKW